VPLALHGKATRLVEPRGSLDGQPVGLARVMRESTFKVAQPDKSPGK
jgi:hypothetical protein